MSTIIMNMKNIPRHKFNIIFDTSIYFKMIYTVFKDKLGIQLQDEKRKGFSQNHLEFLKKILEIVKGTEGCIYIYAELVSDQKGLDKEYEDMRKEMEYLNRLAKNVRNYNAYVQRILKNIFPYNTIENILLSIGGDNTNSTIRARALSKIFVMSLLRSLFSLIYSTNNICYVFFDKSNRKHDAFCDRFIKDLNEGDGRQCRKYDNILYRVLEDIYEIYYNFIDIRTRKDVGKCYEKHLIDLCKSYLKLSHPLNNGDGLLDDIHILMTPFIFNEETLNIFCTDDWCKCNAEFLSGDRYGVIVAVTFGKCSDGDARFFIDRFIGERLVNALRKELSRINKDCNDLVVFTCGGFIPLSTQNGNICFGIIYLCED